MDEFKATVVNFPATRLTGMKVRTSLAHAQQDCPAVWQRFGPRMPGIEGRQSFGVSIMLSAEEIEYWAAVEADGRELPADMGHVDVPAGTYVACRVPDLESIGIAYMFIFEKWLGSQETYAYNEQVPCFELYPPAWCPDVPFEIYVPLKG
ncbi:MAG: GyrI-like domain-containing protein [Desulfovibrio desulfuricans]|uniref:Transcription activator effector binding n=1 Tax=Desulfovibrio desulfuricans (strain ATCC 27774 / DSM 6949 / MB) TaxID=525146 RepID=B8J231_DESDA|nr:GyrI-like domain-containing protein [uncultured Desulfovibrio sp.]MDY0203505.1 GyrI-like domain-containing protein [Desulfovibrio desulfuricans]